MRENEVMEQLAALGTEQTRKTYRRHGATGDLFGVLYADLRKLQKRCGTDQALAEALWATGNHDARVLAAMIADPAAMAEPGPAIGSELGAAGAPGNGSVPGSRTGSGPRAERKIARIWAWAAQVDNRPLAAAVSELAAKTPTAVETMTGWIASGEEWLAATGWNVLAILAGRDGPIEGGSIDDATFRRYLQQIERAIHGSPNWVRHAMNSALIAIGLRSPELQAEALAVAQRIGRVVVDHGQTACKTPDAISYIRRAVLRRSENTNAKKKTTANEEPQMTENTTQSSTTKRNNTESAPKTSTKRVADAKPAKKAAKKATKKAGAKKAAKKAGAKKVAKKAAKKVAKKAAKKTGAKKAAKKAAKKVAKKAAKKTGAKKAAKKAGAKKAAKKTGAKKAAKKAGKRAAGNGAAPKKATKRAGKGTTRKQTSPTTSAPPANP